MTWTTPQIPSQDGRLAIITGANSGIGYWAALHLAKAGAHVLLACRNETRGMAAITKIRETVPNAALSFGQLDLADLDSVEQFAKTLHHDRIDLLINNAGVMALPYRKTQQGFEMQLGTNHLGHFALTGRLIRKLAATSGSRVVNVSSHAHKMGKIHFDDLQSEKSYQRWLAYGQSKLANLLFTYELAKRCEAKGVSTLSVACHPGYASTELHTAGANMEGSKLKAWFMDTAHKLVAQPGDAGSWPTLRAATDPEVAAGDYYGPRGFTEMMGPPVKVKSNAASHDADVQERLWQVSEELTSPFAWYSAAGPG